MKLACFFLMGPFFITPTVAIAAEHGEVTAEVVRAAARQLVQHPPLQDVDRGEWSRRWSAEYLLALDPHRMHFLKSDVETLASNPDTPFAEAIEGNVRFARDVAARLRERLQVNLAQAENLLEQEHDFTIDESVLISHDEFARDIESSRQRWRRRIKYELLLEKSRGRNLADAREFLRGRYERVREHFDSLEESNFLSLYLSAMAKSLDPHSDYLDQRYLDRFRIGHIPNYTLGLKLKIRDGDLWIVPSDSRFPNSSLPADELRIVAIHQPGQEPVHLVGLTGGDALRTVQSPVGELQGAKSVFLEVDNPKLGQRFSLASDRWPPRR